MKKLLLFFLFMCSIFCANASESKTILIAINEITDLYLDDKVADAKAKAAFLAETLKKLERNDEAILIILDFLSGKDDANLAKAAGMMEQRPDAWTVVGVALFARNTALAEELDDMVLMNNLGHSMAAGQTATLPQAEQWKEKVKKWYAWCEDAYPVQDDLPPLLRRRAQDMGKQPERKKQDKSLSVNDLSIDSIKKLRMEKYAARPKKEHYDYNLEDLSIKNYLNSLNDETARKLESRRIRYLGGIKQNLVAILERNPYSGSLKTKRGVLNGTIAMANENTFVVRFKGNKKSRTMKWQDLEPVQFAGLLEYYGDMRLKVTGTVSEEEKKAQAANQFFAAAILCDWYGFYPDAFQLLRKTLKANPRLSEKVIEFFLK